ncbi:MAG: BamA/TamA family outer membrane protein, partial [Alphaproteobacteria bacterium]|nr:BamA/TamA family outer membrane protein [Alphaproteobacteria bacterium]
RFYVGGDNLRGFATSGIGPRDDVTGDALGGNEYFTGSVTMGFPLGLPQELGVSGRVFTDFGTLFGIDQANALFNPNTGSNDKIDNTSALRLSVGSGISWKSPFGPIRLDLAVPVLKQAFDKRELFRVGFGTRF